MRQACEFEVLDSQTFIHMVLMAFKNLQVPEDWRKEAFDKISGWRLQFQSIIDYEAISERGREPRNMVNWKQIMTYFLLNESQVALPMEIEAYKDRLEVF